MPDIQRVQDAVIDLAKDLLMMDLRPLIAGLCAAREGTSEAVPIRFASEAKTEAFYRMVMAFHAAHGEAVKFRDAHVSELQQEKASWIPQTNIDSDDLGPDEISMRRAS